jgi:perosamine synthetase
MDPSLNENAERLIPVARPYLAGRKGKFLSECVEASWISGGKFVRKFERLIAAENSEIPAHGVACNSGTTAIHLALKAIWTLPGESVILPTLTMVAVANAVRYCGALPRFVDSELFDGNQSIIESVGPLMNKQAGAIIVPHLYGSISEVPSVLRAAGYDGWIIQDCAESHYGRFADGRKFISHPKDVLTFSFYANKIIATGEGGMVVCHDYRMAERLRSLRAHAFTPGDHFNHQELAFGYRMTDLQAAIGIAQCQRHRKLLRIRARHAQQYIDRLSSIPWLELPRRSPCAVWWVFPILVRREWSHQITVARVREVLADHGIETRRYFRPLHLQQHLQEFALSGQTFPVACDLYERGLYLPLYVGLTNDDFAYIANALHKV